MGNLIIRKVKYEGDFYEYESPDFMNGLNLIVGDNGTGKSTLMLLIYYGLSGAVPIFTKGEALNHIQIVEDTNNYIQLTIEINEEPYVIKRFIGSNDILVFDNKGELTIFPIFRSKNEKRVFSDWILEKLNIGVIEILQGSITHKINFRDLMRLIYHDQELDPREIYKKPDALNYVTDSELLRKSIFELLVGKKFSKLYDDYSKLRKAEIDKQIQKATIEEYIKSTEFFSELASEFNYQYYKKKEQEINDEINVLEKQKNVFKTNLPPTDTININIKLMKDRIQTLELSASHLFRVKSKVYSELSDLQRLKDDKIVETLQLKKILYTHEKLNLFSPDTCPYCLRKINREKNKCICGNEIEETELLKYFYSTDEYIDLLKSLQKSIKTIEQAIVSCQMEIEKIDDDYRIKKIELSKTRKKLAELVESLDSKININAISQIEDKIIALKNDINAIKQKLVIESRKNELQVKYDKLNELVEKLRLDVREDELISSADIHKIVIQFNIIYNDLMINALNDCRSARIKLDNYMPIVDNGKYREASASVPIRLMYYFTLLYLSISSENFPYPRFLLIDTPETAGIDTENLINSIHQYDKIVNHETKVTHQIIMTTGIDRYPKEYEGLIRQTIPSNKLLQRKVNLSSIHNDLAN